MGRWGFAAAQSIHVISPGIDADRWKSETQNRLGSRSRLLTGLPEDMWVVGTATRLVDGKGVESLIEATAQLARELGCDRMKLLELRHKLQAHATAGLDPATLPDPVVEADECYVNAGEKRHPASRPGGPAAAAGQQAPRARDVR